MFKFLKEKLKQGIKSISDKIDEVGTTEETEIETTVEPEKKGFFSKLKDKFSHKAGIEDIKEEETVEQEVKIKDEVEEYQKKEEIKEEKKKLKQKEKKIKEKVEKKETPKIQELTERKVKEEELKEKEKEVEDITSIEEPKSQKSKNSKEFLGHENPKDFHMSKKQSFFEHTQKSPISDESKISEGLEAKSQSEKKGFFKTIKEKITTKKINKEQFEKIFWDLEVALLENNVAVEVIEKIKDDLTQEIVDRPLARGKIEETITNTLNTSIEQLLKVESFNLVEKVKTKKPFVICFVGINGSGKTTTIAKIAKLLKDNGLSIVLVAGDTWRQAAIEQIGEWAKKLKVPLIKHAYGSDPAAVAFDGVQMAKSKGIDVVLIDTAGRMHSNVNLTEEMKKIMRVAKPDLKIFVGESITGNDCVEQSKKFDEAIGLDGIILSKADVDEKGGAAISISYVVQKPIIFIGTGQNLNDLKEFDPSIVIKSLGLV